MVRRVDSNSADRLSSMGALRVGAATILLLLGGCALNDDSGPTPGAWHLAGVDANGVNWTTTFMLERTRAGYSGTFTWKREGRDAGTEDFTGAYDRTARQVTFTGEHVRGAVVRASYTATLSPDRSRMTDGRWTSPEGPPGTWHAERAPN